MSKKKYVLLFGGTFILTCCSQLLLFKSIGFLLNNTIMVRYHSYLFKPLCYFEKMFFTKYAFEMTFLVSLFCILSVVVFLLIFRFYWQLIMIKKWSARLIGCGLCLTLFTVWIGSYYCISYYPGGKEVLEELMEEIGEEALKEIMRKTMIDVDGSECALE